jgi:hypothetical protein
MIVARRSRRTGAYPVWNFRYKNWKGVDHTYVIRVESIELSARGARIDGVPLEGACWQVHGRCLKRDGQYREGQPRRSFLLAGIRDLREELST